MGFLSKITGKGPSFSGGNIAAFQDPATARKGFTWYSSYDATKPKGKRLAPTGLTLDEDRELSPAARRAAISATRNIHRNFAVAAWAIRRHLDYVTDFRFKSKTGNKALDKRIEDLIRWRARKENFDVAGRHTLDRALRMSESRRVVDGDVGWGKLSDGRIQGIEGDRIITPYAGMPPGVDATNVRRGVIVNDAGAAVQYIICKRAKTNDIGYTGQDMVFERIIPARNLLLHACWDLGRFDQVRGISPLLSAYNTYRDVYEGLDYAMVKAKASSLFMYAITRKAGPEEGNLVEPFSDAAAGEQTDGTTDTDPVVTDDEGPRYDVDLGRLPGLLDLDQDDDIKAVESHTPSTEMQSFMPFMISIALKALDIPFSWFDEAYVNFSGGKQAWINYEKSCTVKRDENRELLGQWTRWQLALFIADGVLEMPKGWTLKDLDFEWKAIGTPWLDPLKEALGNLAAIEGGLESPIGVIEKSSDRDWREIIEETAEWLQARRDAGLPDPQWAITEKQVEKNTQDEPPETPPPGKTRSNGKNSLFERALQLQLSSPEEPRRLNGVNSHGHD